MIWSTWYRNCRKWISLIIAQGKELTLKGNFTNGQTKTVFASLLKDIPLRSKDTAIPEPFLRNLKMNAFTFERNTKQPYNDNFCLFWALALHLHGNEKLEEGKSKRFNLFLFACEEEDPSMFQVSHTNDIPNVEDFLQLIIFLYGFDFDDEKLFGELACRSFQKIDNSVNVLRYNIHIYYVINIKAVCKTFHCSTCDTFFSKTGIVEQHLVTCINA